MPKTQLQAYERTGVTTLPPSQLSSDHRTASFRAKYRDEKYDAVDGVAPPSRSCLVLPSFQTAKKKRIKHRPHKQQQQQQQQQQFKNKRGRHSKSGILADALRDDDDDCESTQSEHDSNNTNSSKKQSLSSKQSHLPTLSWMEESIMSASHDSSTPSTKKKDIIETPVARKSRNGRGVVGAPRSGTNSRTTGNSAAAATVEIDTGASASADGRSTDSLPLHKLNLQYPTRRERPPGPNPIAGSVVPPTVESVSGPAGTLLQMPKPTDRSHQKRLEWEQNSRRKAVYEGELEPEGVRGQEARVSSTPVSSLVSSQLPHSSSGRVYHAPGHIQHSRATPATVALTPIPDISDNEDDDGDSNRDGRTGAAEKHNGNSTHKHNGNSDHDGDDDDDDDLISTASSQPFFASQQTNFFRTVDDGSPVNDAPKSGSASTQPPRTSPSAPPVQQPPSRSNRSQHQSLNTASATAATAHGNQDTTTISTFPETNASMISNDSTTETDRELQDWLQDMSLTDTSQDRQHSILAQSKGRMSSQGGDRRRAIVPPYRASGSRLERRLEHPADRQHSTDDDKVAPAVRTAQSGHMSNVMEYTESSTVGRNKGGAWRQPTKSSNDTVSTLTGITNSLLESADSIYASIEQSEQLQSQSESQRITGRQLRKSQSRKGTRLSQYDEVGDGTDHVDNDDDTFDLDEILNEEKKSDDSATATKKIYQFLPSQQAALQANGGQYGAGTEQRQQQQQQQPGPTSNRQVEAGGRFATADAPAPVVGGGNGSMQSPGRSSTRQKATTSVTAAAAPARADSNPAKALASANTISAYSRRSAPVDVDDSSFIQADDNVQGINAMAMEHVMAGEYDMALHAFAQVLKVYRKQFNTEAHPLVASAYHNLGTVHSKRASLLMDNTVHQRHCQEQALLCFQAAARSARDSPELGPNHPNVAVSLVRIGFLLLQARQYDHAITTFREALRIRRHHYGSQHGLVANLYNNLGVCYMHLGKFQVGRESLQNALDIQQSNLRHSTDAATATATQYLELADTLCNIGGLCLEWIRRQGPDVRHARDAESSFLEALEIRTKVLGPQDPLVQQVRSLHDMVRSIPLPNGKGRSAGDSQLLASSPGNTSSRAQAHAVTPSPNSSKPGSSHTPKSLSSSTMAPSSSAASSPRPIVYSWTPRTSFDSASPLQHTSRADKDTAAVQRPSPASRRKQKDNLPSEGGSSRDNPLSLPKLTGRRDVAETESTDPDAPRTVPRTSAGTDKRHASDFSLPPADQPGFASKQQTVVSPEPKMPSRVVMATHHIPNHTPTTGTRSKLLISKGTAGPSEPVTDGTNRTHESKTSPGRFGQASSVSKPSGLGSRVDSGSSARGSFNEATVKRFAYESEEACLLSRPNLDRLESIDAGASSAGLSASRYGGHTDRDGNLVEQPLSEVSTPQITVVLPSPYQNHRESGPARHERKQQQQKAKSQSNRHAAAKAYGYTGNEGMTADAASFMANDSMMDASDITDSIASLRNTFERQYFGEYGGADGDMSDDDDESENGPNDDDDDRQKDKERLAVMFRAKAILAAHSEYLESSSTGAPATPAARSHQPAGIVATKNVDPLGAGAPVATGPQNDARTVNGNNSKKRTTMHVKGVAPHSSSQQPVEDYGNDDGLAPLGGDWPPPLLNGGLVTEEMKREPELYLHNIHAGASRYLKKNRFEDALSLFQIIVQCQKRVNGPSHAHVGAALHNVGIVNLRLQRHYEALQSFEEAVRVRKAALGRDHPQVAVSLVKVGITLLLLQRFGDSLWIFREALSVRKNALGPLHPSTARIYNNIGCVHVEFQELREARRAFEAALDIQRNALVHEPDNGPLLFGAATTLCNLGYLYKNREMHEKSALVLREALSLQEKVLGRYHPTVLSTLDSLAESCAASNHVAHASRYYNEILDRFAADEAGGDIGVADDPNRMRARAVVHYKLSRVYAQQPQHVARQREALELALGVLHGMPRSDASHAELDALAKRIEADLGELASPSRTTGVSQPSGDGDMNWV